MMQHDRQDLPTMQQRLQSRPELSGAKGEVMSDWYSKHTKKDMAALIEDLEARLEAMTLQHEAALEAVKKAREAALREAAGVAADFVHRMYRADMPVCSYHAGEAKAAILALINKGDSRE